MGLLSAFWGVSGFLLLLVYAVYRLALVALQALSGALTWYHWVVLLGNIAFMAYYEGYKGFQRGYSPRLVARASYLIEQWTPLRLLLAPLFCMGFFHAPKRRIVSAVVLTIVIIVLVSIFRQLPQPWRGVLDAGVVVGLAWGIVATLALVARALIARDPGVDPEVPCADE